MNQSFDIIVIGAGPGGYVAAIRAAQLGLKVAIMERESLGGICLNWGCIPTKALLKSAETFEYLQHASDYGLSVQQPKADFTAIIKRSRKIADDMSKGIDFLMKKNKITVLMGEASVAQNRKVILKTSENKQISYTAKHIMLATGARSRSLAQLPMNGKTIFGYREAMSLKRQPKHLLVVGAGAIGMEFAYFYHTLGTKVEVIEAQTRILPTEDAEVSAYMHKYFEKKGLTIHTEAKLESCKESKKEVEVSIQIAHREKKVLRTEAVLSAVGISTNLQNLGLEKLGIQTQHDRVVVDDFYRTSVEGIYAIGDIVKGPALAHVASAEGIICVEKIAGKTPEALDYNNLPACTYCQPEIASVGYTEEAAKQAGYKLRIGKFPFSASGKAKAAGHTTGFVKVIFEEKYGECLGAHMVGAHVTEMIAEIVAARKLETTGYEIIKSVHPHPTLSEAVMEATAAAYKEVIHL